MEHTHCSPQETRLADAESITEGHYTFFWFGRTYNQPRLYRAGFAVRNDLIDSVQTPTAVNDRISSLMLNNGKTNMLLSRKFLDELATIHLMPDEIDFHRVPSRQDFRKAC